MPGSTVLIAGDPGIGKSTLLLQVAGALGSAGNGSPGVPAPCAYISGEEAVEQLHLRARRLGLAGAPVLLATATSVHDIAASLDGAEPPAVVVIDSIQTMYVDSLDSAPGTVSQVRASAQELIRLAKARGFVLLLVGHVTKDGQIAGPKVLEHMVDTVLAFEGERGHQFRILRATKNRFGPIDEIGVFEMTDAGLTEVANPSALFLAERRGNVAGAAVFAGIEGQPPDPGRDSGPGLAVAAGDPAPRRGRLGRRAPGHGAGGARGALRAGASGQGGLSERRRGLARERAGGGPGGRRSPGLGRHRPAGPGRDRGVRRDRAVGGNSRGQPGRGTAQGGRQAGLHRRLDATPAQKRRPNRQRAQGRRGSPGRFRTCRIWCAGSPRARKPGER